MIAILLFTFFSFSVWAETTNETTISGDVVIPSTRGDYSVTSTGDAAFTYKVTFNANGVALGS